MALGAQIEGIGTNTVTVHGPAVLKGATYRIGADHIEVGSFIGLAAVTKSSLRIANAGVEHLRSIRMGFERLGITCQVEGDDLIVPEEQRLEIRTDLGGTSGTGRVIREIIRHRHERGATLITTNRDADEIPALFGDPLLASAAMDRLLHNAHVLAFEGESYRNPPPNRRRGATPSSSSRDPIEKQLGCGRDG